MDNVRLLEIETRAKKATEGPILKRMDYDYYQGGLYLGTEPYYYGVKDGKYGRLEGIQEGCEPEYFKNDIFKVEGEPEDVELFINARQDILDLVKEIKRLKMVWQ